MTNYIKRLVYIDAEETTKINPLVWPFFVAIIVYGLGFTFFGAFDWVSSSSLWQSFDGAHHWLPAVWGFFALTSGLSALAMVLWRKASLGSIAAMSGFLVWSFALIMYALNGYLLVSVTVAAANLYFWAYYYRRFAWYNQMKKLGKITDPE